MCYDPCTNKQGERQNRACRCRRKPAAADHGQTLLTMSAIPLVVVCSGSSERRRARGRDRDFEMITSKHRDRGFEMTSSRHTKYQTKKKSEPVVSFG